MDLPEPDVDGNSLVDVLSQRENEDAIAAEPLPSDAFRKMKPGNGTLGFMANDKNSTKLNNYQIQDNRFKLDLASSPLVDITDSYKRNISETLFALPKSDTPGLTKLITGKEGPTLVQEQPIKPILNTDKNAPKFDEKGNKILASYRILIPILIPAVKRKNSIKLRGPGGDEFKYVKETHTEMVPVTKQIPKIKTVLKAERVPQKIVTDFVRADGKTVPSGVDDKLLPNEHLIKTVVTNYD